MPRSSMRLTPHESVVEKLGEFHVIGAKLAGLKVSASSTELVRYVRQVESRIRSEVNIEDVKDDAIFRSYRDFFWRTGIDPTKTRPASEALTRRILLGRELPLINSFVDALNIASVETKVPFAAFDHDCLETPLVLRFADEGEVILPIGHSSPVTMDGREIVISDAKKLIAVYPHRDSDETKITHGTSAAIVLSCGVPGVDVEKIRVSLDDCCERILQFCGGVRLDL